MARISHVKKGDEVVVISGSERGRRGKVLAVLGKSERVIVEEDPITAYEKLRTRLRGDELILLKASRGVALERLLPLLEKDLGVSHPHGEAGRPGARSPRTDTSDDAQSAGHSQHFAHGQEGAR